MSVAVVVSSHDKYSFCWEPFAHGFKKYWSDCPWPVYFITNHKDGPIGETIKVGEDKDWSSNMLQALNRIPETTILFLLEDYWLFAPTNTQEIISLSKHIANDRADYIRLVPSSDAHLQTFDVRISRYTKQAVYPTSLNVGLWKKEHLQSLLVPGDTIWEFEADSPMLLQSYSRHFAVNKHDYIHYIHPDDPLKVWNDTGAMTQGKLTPSSTIWLQEEGLVLHE